MEKRKVRFRLSLTDFLYNGCFASANYLSVFLQSLGISAGQIGLITSLTNVMGVVSQPVWGTMSDKIRSVRKCFILIMLLSGACVVGIPSLAASGVMGYMPVFVLVVMLYFFVMPSNMVMEMWLVRVDRDKRIGVSYGSMRIWASIGFSLFSLCLVPVLEHNPVSCVYYFYAGFAVLAAAAALTVPKYTDGYENAPKQRLRDMPFKKILTRAIITYLIFEIIFQIAFGWRNSYFVYALNAYGIKSSSFGTFMCVSGLFEVPMLIYSKRLIDRFGLKRLLIAATLLMGIEYGVYAAGSSVAALVIGQVFKGFGYALYVACRYQYVMSIAPKGLEGSTQAVVNASYTAVSILAAAFGGYILQGIGTRPFFWLLAGIQFVAAAFFLFTQFRKADKVE